MELGVLDETSPVMYPRHIIRSHNRSPPLLGRDLFSSFTVPFLLEGGGDIIWSPISSPREGCMIFFEVLYF